MRMTNRDRRDWSLLIFIVPVGILLMMIAGWFALWAVPQWSLQAGMGSSLEIGADDGRGGPRPLINPQILTPFSWLGSYLTPSGDNPFFVPFVVIQPSATPSASVVPITTTETPPVSVTVSPPVTVVTTPPANTSTATATNKPPNDEGTPPIPTTCQDSAATNFGGPLPCAYPPITCQDPAASNFGGPLPCTYPPTTCQDPAATNFGGPLPCIYPPPGITSTPDPSWVLATVPPELNIGTPDDDVGEIVQDYVNTPPPPHYVASYIIVDISGNPVYVAATPDDYYDIVFYEFNNGGAVYMDHIIIGISNSDVGDYYYEVFYWGDGLPDDNSNVGPLAGPEDVNQEVQLTDLYPDPGTGILIDVDNATSLPPEGAYNYIIIIAPTSGAPDPAEVDAIQITEVPIPTPTP